jgi:hypothetical protein
MTTKVGSLIISRCLLQASNSVLDAEEDDEDDMEDEDMMYQPGYEGVSLHHRPSIYRFVTIPR